MVGRVIIRGYVSKHEMKKPLLTGIAALFLTTGTVHASEILLAVMLNDKNAPELHKITLIDGACTKLLCDFQEQARPIWLTLPGPTFTGRIVVDRGNMPDGSKRRVKAGKPS